MTIALLIAALFATPTLIAIVVAIVAWYGLTLVLVRMFDNSMQDAGKACTRAVWLSAIIVVLFIFIGQLFTGGFVFGSIPMAILTFLLIWAIIAIAGRNRGTA